jgi:hypothetical protein
LANFENAREMAISKRECSNGRHSDIASALKQTPSSPCLKGIVLHRRVGPPFEASELLIDVSAEVLHISRHACEPTLDQSEFNFDRSARRHR